MNKMIRPVLLALTIGIAAPGVAMARGGDDDRNGRNRYEHDDRYDRYDRRDYRRDQRRDDRYDRRQDRQARRDYYRGPVVIHQPAPRVIYRPAPHVVYQPAPRVVYEPVYLPPRPVYIEPGVSVRINVPIRF